MIRSYEAEVSEDGQVRLLDPLALRGRHRAVLTLLEPLETKGEDAQTLESLASGGGTSLLRFLRENRLPTEARLSADEIDAQIAEERGAWG